jgi:hypothetical protein
MNVLTAEIVFIIQGPYTRQLQMPTPDYMTERGPAVGRWRMSESAAIKGYLAARKDQATGAGEMCALTLGTRYQVSFEQDLQLVSVRR